MKKIFAILFVAAVMVAGLFADGAFPSGKWVDDNWNGEWVIGVGTIELLNSKTGESICKFDSEKMKDYKVDVTNDGLALSFYYAETQRAYSFIKDASGSANIILRVNADWLEEDYQVVLSFKEAYKAE